MKDYYSILRVSKNASNEEIRQAFRNLAKIYHPDVNNSSEATEKMKEIVEAYTILSDENKRRKYDILLTQQLNIEIENSNLLKEVLNNLEINGTLDDYVTETKIMLKEMKYNLKKSIKIYKENLDSLLEKTDIQSSYQKMKNKIDSIFKR